MKPRGIAEKSAIRIGGKPVAEGGSMSDIKQNTAVKPQAAGAFDGDRYQSRLNPDAMAGQNIGAAGAHPEKRARTVHDFKELHARFREWSDGDLKQIPVVPEGSRLEQNATYIDLMAATPHEFTATGNMEAGRGHRYVPKSEVPYELWNRLLGVKNVIRTGVSRP
jgi:hypothetical protein